MNTAEETLEFERLAREIRGNAQVASLIRDLIRDEMGVKEPHAVRRGLPQSEMPAVMRRVEELRKQISLPADVVDELIEEHRREFGRGPLTKDVEDDGR